VVVNGYMYIPGGATGSGVAGSTSVYYTSGQRLQVNASLDLVGGYAGTEGDGGAASGSSGGSLTAGNTRILGTLDVQSSVNLTQDVTIGGSLNLSSTLSVAGAATFSSTLTVTGAATFNGALTVSGTATFAGHVKSTQTTAPTVPFIPLSCGASPTASFAAGSTDSAGSFTITVGTGGTQTICDTAFAFNSAYGAAPKSIVLTPKTSAAAASGAYVYTINTAAFGVKVTNPPADSAALTFYYWVVE
jgi:hypothetical protein